ncbi:MAG: CAP domain-containing protein, partial [bacterium]
TINNPKQYRKDLEEQLLKEVNNFRKQRDLSTLGNDTYYEQAAQNHSKNMVELNFFSHRDPDGNSPLDRIQQIRSNYARSILENLARHSPTPLPGIAGEVLRGWENSPGHRKNLLTKNVRKSGFGISFDYDQNLIFITHNFGNTHQ